MQYLTVYGEDSNLMNEHEMTFDDDDPKSVLFVCIGNVCRSPVCEGLLRKLTNGKIRTDSAAIAEYDVNHPPETNSITVAMQNGFDISKHRARLLTPDDFSTFDMIVSLEPSVLTALRRRKPAKCHAKLVELVPRTAVINPYGKPLSDFEKMYAQIAKGMKNLLRDYFGKKKRLRSIDTFFTKDDRHSLKKEEPLDE